jgi:hypothetical protein
MAIIFKSKGIDKLWYLALLKTKNAHLNRVHTFGLTTNTHKFSKSD